MAEAPRTLIPSWRQEPGANSRAVRAALEAFARRDIEAAAQWLHPAVKFEPLSTDIAERRSYFGTAGMRQYFADLDATWDRFQVAVFEYRESEDCVVAIGRVQGMRGSVTIDDPIAIAWKLRGGKLVWGRVFSSPRAALAAVGL
jgi:ketosteroid isomerase-like protein